MHLLVKMTERKVHYALWDDKFNDFILIPGPDNYLHSTLPDFDLLKFCAGTGSPLVRVTIEPLVVDAPTTTPDTNQPPPG